MSGYTDPKEWGPHYWYVMRCVANNYPISPTNRNRLEVRRFFEDIGNVLPCEKCIKHYKETCKKYPIDSNVCCRDCLMEWVEKVYLEIKEKTTNDSSRYRGQTDTKYNTKPLYPKNYPDNKGCNCKNR